MDGPPAVALGFEKEHGNVMDRPPRPVKEGLPNFRDITLIFYLGAVMVTGTLIVFFLAGGGIEACEGFPLSTDSALPFDQAACEAGDEGAMDDWQTFADERFVHAQTMTFGVFIMFQLFNVMNCRSNKESIFKLGLMSNKAINWAFLISFLLLVFFIQFSYVDIPLVGIDIGGLLSTTAINLNDWFILISVAFGVLVVDEFRKFIVNSRYFAVK